LNPDNVVAQKNRDFNRELAVERKAVVRVGPSLEDQFGSARSWDQVLLQNGPFDEPSFCFALGWAFATNGLYRQAIQQFERVRRLAPDDLLTRQWLLKLYMSAPLDGAFRYDRVLELIQEVRARPAVFPLTLTNRAELLFSEATARFGLGDAGGGALVLEAARAAEPTNLLFLAVAAQVYLQQGDFTNALRVINQQLEANPADPTALGNKGYVCLQLKAYDAAIPPLTRLLTLETNNLAAKLNRAIACLQSGHLEAAQRDYEELHRQFPTAYQLHYGLAEIAYRQRQTNTARRYYQLYLSNAPPDSAEAAFVRQRLQQLQPPAS